MSSVLNSISPRFKKFDVYVKAADGITEQTVLGAFVTLLSACIVMLLLFSELSTYMKKDIVSRMVVDSTTWSDEIQLNVDLEFLKLPCEKITFMQEVTRGSVSKTIQPTEDIKKSPLGSNSENQGCWVYGTITTNKVGGNFRFGMETPHPDNAAVPEALRGIPGAQRPGIIPPDLSHRINHVIFNPVSYDKLATDKLPQIKHPLNGQRSDVPVGAGLYQYAIQVVPTTYEPFRGESTHINQYSVTERLVDIEQTMMGVTLSGQHFSNFIGVVFTYDFYPVRLVMEERKESIFEFLASLCGIVGGVITVLGLFEGCVYQSTKALIGKKD